MTKEQWRQRQAQWKELERWEHQQMRRLRLPLREAFRIFDELYQLARALGSWRKSDSPGDLGPERRIATFVNRRRGD